MTALTAVIESTTREQLGPDATERDLEAYCEALSRLQSSLEAAAEALNQERRQPVSPPLGYFES